MSSNTVQSSGMKVMTRKQLFNIMERCQAKTFNEKLDYLEDYLLNYYEYSEEERANLKHKISHTKSEFNRRWVSAKYKKHLFESQI